MYFELHSTMAQQYNIAYHEKQARMWHSNNYYASIPSRKRLPRREHLNAFYIVSTHHKFTSFTQAVNMKTTRKQSIDNWKSFTILYSFSASYSMQQVSGSVVLNWRQNSNKLRIDCARFTLDHFLQVREAGVWQCLLKVSYITIA